jgi:hypothetical protein
MPYLYSLLTENTINAGHLIVDTLQVNSAPMTALLLLEIVKSFKLLLCYYKFCNLSAL